MSRHAERTRPHLQAELRRARDAEARADAATARRHLERAHVPGPRSTRHPVHVHLPMLRRALRRRDAAEAAGQGWRVFAALRFTPLGLLPAGHTGGADAGGLRPLPNPADLQELIDNAR